MRLVWGLVALLGVMPPGASAQEKTARPNPGGASALEQALVEHACRSQLPGIAGEDAYKDCLTAQLRSIRVDFGRDLGRVSVEDRKVLDTACTKAREAEGRQAYLECLTLQLAAIRNRRSPNRQASDAAALPQPVDSGAPAPLVIPASEPSSSLLPVWIVVGVVTVVAAIGGAFLAVKSRKAATRTCRVCGGEVSQGGDLCPTCRHEVAETARQAAAERLGHQKAQAEEEFRQSARGEEQRRQRAQEEDAARLRQEEEIRRKEEEARRKERDIEESRKRSRAGGEESEDAFDPHAILGVSPDASKEVIYTACEEARLKYAPEHVAHLGPELQEHYKRKAEAVERAYKLLCE